MTIEPPSLGIPLEPVDRFWAKSLIVIALIAGALVRFAPGLGIPFAATALVVLPPLAPLLLSRRAVSWLSRQTLWVRGCLNVLVFACLATARRHIAPALTHWLGSFL